MNADLKTRKQTNRMIHAGLLLYMISLFWAVPDYEEHYVPSLFLILGIFPLMSVGLNALMHGDMLIGIFRLTLGIFGMLIGNIMMLNIMIRRGKIVPSKRNLVLFSISTGIIILFMIKVILMAINNTKGLFDNLMEMGGMILWGVSFVLVNIGIFAIDRKQ